MAIGDVHELRYMLGKTLALLLADRHRGTSEPLTVEFTPVTGASCGHGGRRPLLPSVLHLINLWLATKSFVTDVLPFLSQLYIFGDATEADAASGAVDWNATLHLWASIGRDDNRVVRKRKKQALAVVENRFIEKILVEIIQHCLAIEDHFGQITLGKGDPLQQMLSEIISRRVKIEQRRMALFGDGDRDGCLEVIELAKLLRRELERPEPTFRDFFLIYCENANKCLREPPMRNLKLLPLTRVIQWRAQYLSGDIWLGEEAEFTVTSTRGPANIFELWCFVELVTCAERLGLFSVVQNSFLTRADRGAEFKFSEGKLAYFDFDARRFREARADHLVAVDHRSALPRAHVEWFIRDPTEFSRSVVIDAKYRGWDSGQALKVLGYMKNFGTLKGAVIFAESIASTEAHSNNDGVLRFDCPGNDSGSLWALSMIPKVSNESDNNLAMTRFISEAIVGVRSE